MFEVLGWKREFYQVLRLFFTGRTLGRCQGLGEQAAPKSIRKNAQNHNQKVAQGIFLISSFNLYAPFALLNVVRFNQTTVSTRAARLSGTSLAIESIRVFAAA
jgi:hypothetical protein